MFHIDFMLAREFVELRIDEVGRNKFKEIDN